MNYIRVVVESCFFFRGGGDIGLSFVLALLSLGGRVLMASVCIVHGKNFVVWRARPCHEACADNIII